MSCLRLSRVGSSVSARRAAIDGELAELSKKAALLKAERNSLAPISALPNELLVRVLAAFTTGTALSMRSPPELARLMLVCRHWSSIIGAFPSLWEEITVRRPYSKRSLAAQLSRTGVAPVRLYIEPLDSFYTPIILASAIRIKILDLGGTPRDLVDFIQTMQDIDFPILCSLRFSAHHGEHTEPAVHLPPNLLGRMPSLCNISLRGINIDTLWECLPPLRSLRLSATAAYPLNLIPLPSLLRFLQRSPDLRTLKLESMVQHGSVDSSLQVELPHLKLLHLLGMLEICEDLIDHLIFPPSARLLLYPGYISTVEDTRHILVPISNHLRAPTAPIATTLALISRIHMHDRNYFQTVTYPTTSTSSRTPDNDALFAIHAVPSSIAALGEVMEKVFNGIPTHTITHFDATSAILTADLWKTVFVFFSGIQTVRIGVGAKGKGFCDGAVVAGLTLRRLDIVVHLSKDEEVVSTEEFLNALMRMLRFWDGIGKRLATLHLDDYFDDLKVTGAREAEVKSLVDEFSRGMVAVYHNRRFL